MSNGIIPLLRVTTPILIIIINVGFVWITWRRRLYPISHRPLGIIMLWAMSGFFSLSIYFYARIYEDSVPCFWYAFALWYSSGASIIGSGFTAVWVYYNFYLNDEMAFLIDRLEQNLPLVDPDNIFIRYRRLLTNQNMVNCLGVSYFLTALLLVMVLSLTPTYSSEVVSVNNCHTGPLNMYQVAGIEMGFMSPALWYFMFKARHIEDHIGLTSELKVTTFSAMIFFFFPCLISSFDAVYTYSKDTFNVIDLFFLIGFISMIYPFLLGPIIKSYKMAPKRTGQTDRMSSLRSNHRMEDALSDPMTYEAFKNFVASEYSAENLIFWKVVKVFKEHNHGAENDNHEMLVQAKLIYRAFFLDSSSMLLNIPYATHKSVHRKFHDGNVDVDVFDESLFDIVLLMERDSFRRFMITWDSIVEAI